MSERLQWVIMMFVAASIVYMIAHYFTESWRWSLAISGLLLIADLTFVPKLLPHIFNKKTRKDDE